MSFFSLKVPIMSVLRFERVWFFWKGLIFHWKGYLTSLADDDPKPKKFKVIVSYGILKESTSVCVRESQQERNLRMIYGNQCVSSLLLFLCLKTCIQCQVHRPVWVRWIKLTGACRSWLLRPSAYDYSVERGRTSGLNHRMNDILCLRHLSSIKVNRDYFIS